MATCIQTLSGSFQAIGLSNNIPYTNTIDSDINAIYSLSSSMDQSIFLNIRMITSFTSINATLTIYKKDTLQIFGTMAINRTNVSSSFNIKAGEYYICIRSILLEYTVELTASFINYVTVPTFNPVINTGFECNAELTFKRVEVDCNKPLLYKIIEGSLPYGLIMLENGYINGTLPMLDVDEFNKDLPTSNIWYEKIHDDQYVTSWGRYYRFKVHLYLEGFYEKGVEQWFWISILNDFNKNLRFIDQYDMLQDERIATFEEQVKLDTIRLCPDPCAVIENISKPSNDEVISVIDGEVYNVSDKNKFYFDIEANYTDEDDVIINEITDGFMYDDELSTEMILLNKQYVEYYNGIPVINSSNGNNDIPQFYIDNLHDEDNILIIQLKDSCMFQRYLMENDISSMYIDMDAYERFDYNNIVIDIHELDGEYYIRMMNNNGIEKEVVDSQDKYVDLYEDSFRKLPLTVHTIFGYQSEGTLK